jgi:hypothetical protein
MKIDSVIHARLKPKLNYQHCYVYYNYKFNCDVKNPGELRPERFLLKNFDFFPL